LLIHQEEESALTSHSGARLYRFMLHYFSNAAWPMQTREETNTEASLLITPLAGHGGWQKITFSTRRGERNML